MEGQDSGENTKEEQSQRVTAELGQVQACIGPRFRRAEARLRAGCILHGLLTPVERKNRWQMAEELGEQGSRGVRWLLGEYVVLIKRAEQNIFVNYFPLMTPENVCKKYACCEILGACFDHYLGR